MAIQNFVEYSISLQIVIIIINIIIIISLFVRWAMHPGLEFWT